LSVVRTSVSSFDLISLRTELIASSSETGAFFRASAVWISESARRRTSRATASPDFIASVICFLMSSTSTALSIARLAPLRQAMLLVRRGGLPLRRRRPQPCSPAKGIEVMNGAPSRVEDECRENAPPW